jgi:hypothetical protein
MATVIRRMSRDELDRLNAEGKAWRERNKPDQNQTPAIVVTDMPVPDQLQLWNEPPE